MPRDGSGNYTLPAGNPVVSGTVISSAWANPTMEDIAAALTDSLSRTGNGGMQVGFRSIDGTVSAPAYSFNNSSASGMSYDDLTPALNLSLAAAKILSIIATGISIAGAVLATGGISGTTLNLTGLATMVNATLTGTLSVTGLTSLVNTAIAGTLGVTGKLTSNGEFAINNAVTEKEFTLVTAISSTNGTIQTRAIGGNVTFTETLANGQSVTLMLNYTSGTVTWPAGINWFGGAPALEAGMNVVTMWHTGGTLYASYGGVVE